MAHKNSALPVIIVLVVLIAAAGGAGYYFMNMQESSRPSPEATPMDSAADEQPASPSSIPVNPADVQTAAGKEDVNVTEKVSEKLPEQSFTVEEGNPVVAKVDGKDITRVDVYRFIQTMPANMQQLPPATLYPMALEQVVNTRLIQNKADTADVTENQAYQQQLAMAKQQIARNVYMQELIQEKVSEDMVKQAYDNYVKSLPEEEERSARHILVPTEEKAKAIIEKLGTGEKFEDLAKSLSTGPTGPRGGDLGYFTQKDMVPEFANAAFSLKKGDVSAPVQTQFGWHVIKIEDIRTRPTPTYEELKPALEAEVRRAALEDQIKKWREGAQNQWLWLVR